MEWFLNVFIDPLSQIYFQKALIGGSIIAIVCGVVGCLVVLRRMAFLGDALSHAMIAGVGGGYLFMKLLFGIEAHAPAMLIGSVIAAVLTVGLISFVARVSRVKEDAAIGIMYCGVFAGGVVLVSIFRNHIHIDLMHFIMGDVLGVADSDLWISAFVAALVLSIMVLFFRHFQLTSFDPVMAASIGMPVVLIDHVLTTCVSLVVVSAVSMVGVILVVGLLIAPAATAYLLSDRLERMMILAAIFGVTSVVGGLYISLWLDSAGGGAIVLFSTFQFLVVLFIAPKYGLLADWLRKRRMVPQQVVEDILRYVLNHKGARAGGSALREAVSDGHRLLGKAINYLSAQGLLVIGGDGTLSLTDSGEREALRIQRAHRLWETYLQHLGTKPSDLHTRAMELEHFSDRESVDYLSHVLGHPERDPHGSLIPSVASIDEHTFQISQMQTGQQGIVDSIDPQEHPCILRVGDRIEMSARDDHGATWVVQSARSGEVRLDHEGADSVRVRHIRIDE